MSRDQKSRWTVTFEAHPRDEPAIIRLRKVMKVAAALGLRCVRAIPERSPDSFRHAERPGGRPKKPT